MIGKTEPMTETEDAEREEDGLERWNRINATLAELAMRPYRALYLKTRNPIHALAAYDIARAAKVDIPDWILELFDQWAQVLTVSRPKGPKAIVGALGLGTKGGPSLTLQAETEIRDLRIARRVYELRSSGRRFQDVFHQVAEEYYLSSERVSSIWYDLTRGSKR